MLRIIGNAGALRMESLSTTLVLHDMVDYESCFGNPFNKVV